MKHIALDAKRREAGNKSAAKALRREGLVPCNLYGNKLENVLFTISAKDLKPITNTPYAHIIDITLDNGEKYSAILGETQWHPVTEEALHVDFLAISEDKPVTVSVPIKVTGHSEGVKMGGKLLVSARKLKISALVKDLPDEVEVDTTNLKIGKQITAGMLSYDNINIVSPKATIICSVQSTRAVATGEAAAE